MQPDRKVYDSDIRRSTKLREIAHEYAREYIGNFEMMIEAREYYEAHGCLAEGMYRPVLNTLRTDAIFQGLWEQAQSMMSHPTQAWSVWDDDEDELADVVPMSRARPAQRIIERPNWVIYHDKPFKFPYGTAKQKAKHPVIHLMVGICDVRWERPRIRTNRFWEYQKDAPLSECSLIVKTYCRRTNYSGMRFWRELPTIGEAWVKHDPSESSITPPLCRSCQNSYEDEHGKPYVP